MRIEKIELLGFKSFAEKTIFTFHPGITCVVGPNGCGKSNIVDAFRWVLGEQSAKTLRGDRMEEVIFNGSRAKKPHGMTEVTLHLLFPDEQGDGQSLNRLVTVTRRLYRSGESEYLINKQVCRLKDIRDMFLDTGLEMKSYSIIEQGRIGEIINTKPQDRRFLIEEVAGVMKYKVRKAEAQSKLDSSKLNLQRVNDITSEVKRQLNSITRQAKKAERFKNLSDELRKIELRLAKRDLIELDQTLQNLTNTLTGLKDKEVSKRASISSIESTLQHRKLQIVEKEEEIDAINRELNNVEKKLSDIERQLIINRKDLDYLNNHILSLSKQIDTTTKLIEGEKAHLNDISGKYEHIQTRLNSLKESTQEEEERLLEFEEAIHSLEGDINERRRELFNTTDSIGTKRNAFHRLEATKEGLIRRLNSSEREIEEAERRLTEISQELESIKNVTTQHNKHLSAMRDKRAHHIQELSEQKGELEGSKNKKVALLEDMASLRSRIRSLQEMITDNINIELLHSEGINALAAISDVIEVDQSYEKAVEAALSDKIKGFILSSKEDIKKSVQLINLRNLPRTALISPDLSYEKINPGTTVKSQMGKVLTNFVRSSDKYKGLVDALLGDCVLIDTIEDCLHSLENIANLPSHIRIVTLNGEVVEPGGAVICGIGLGILKLRRELRELHVLSGEKRAISEEIDTLLNSTNKKIEELKNSLRTVESEIVSEEKEISISQASEKRNKEDMERFTNKLSLLRLEKAGLQDEINSIEETVAKTTVELLSEDNLKISLEQELNNIQNSLSLKRTTHDAKRHTVTELKIELNRNKERLKALTNERTGLEKEISRLVKRKTSLKNETDQKGIVINETNEETKVLEAALRKAVSSADELRQGISLKAEAIRDKKEAISTAEKRLKEERQILEGLSEETHRKELLKTELSMKKSNIVNSLVDKYSVDLSSTDIPASDSYEDDQKTLIELKEKIQAMGPVPLGFLEEYKGFSERYEFLKRQQDDIVRSIGEVEEAINKINITTKKRLREAFASLNQKFDEVFRLLFNGGNAELKLIEEVNILDSGIEIKVQPPGKRLQNINLLSGGEKALSALSLLFAGFLLKPTPLCILDEADAHLDESNTGRFCAMIRELSRDLQFIVITHNRITMESTDYLYGITMEEPGISKAFSMELV